MNILFIAGLILVALGILLLFAQPKEDKRTKTGFEKNATTSYGMCYILISIGAGLLYFDSKFFSDEKNPIYLRNQVHPPMKHKNSAKIRKRIQRNPILKNLIQLEMVITKLILFSPIPWFFKITCPNAS